MTAANVTRRNLGLLLQGQFVTHMGNQIYDIAMLLWIKEVTGSAALMGLALLLTNMPQALLAPLPCQSLASYRADGREGNLNHYVVLRAGT